MPRKRNSTNGSFNATPKRRSARRSAPKEDSIPDVFKDMLVEAYEKNPTEFQSHVRPAKRQKTELNAVVRSEDTADADDAEVVDDHELHQATVNDETRRQHVVLDDFDASEADSDADFEDVPLNLTGLENYKDSIDSPTQEETLRLDFSSVVGAETRLVQRRKPVSKAERAVRLDVHKWHLLCLLMHTAIRNEWCNDEVVQATLMPLVPKKVIKWLHVDVTESQAQRKVSFEKGIEELLQLWKLQWKTTNTGLRRAIWKENIDMVKEMEKAEEPLDLDDFRETAKVCRGSRDVGAQLFCALLRSAAVEARLVCSLQVLPFSRVAKGETPEKSASKPTYLRAGVQDFGTSPRSAEKKERVLASPYPVFWVEVFSPSIQQWLPVDAVVRYTVNKPRTGFEPPATDTLNSMTYVVAFEEDGTAKDVTLRYASAFNAKTRKLRVESLKGGKTWYEGAMDFFRRANLGPRDDIENAELERRTETEGMPKNVQDFKDHPVYVLERHLRANEVIEPKREVGKFGAMSGKNGKLESVYRRQDVHLCRSADAWYRRGRDVEEAQQPLRRGLPKQKDSQRRDGNTDEENDEGIPLYAEFQTRMYAPPPVVDGIVPRNAFGNLDIYVPSMIPPGAVHIKHSLATEAARLLKVDFAEAVVGFRFKGRHGTAVIDGVVVDTQRTAAMLAVIEGLQEQLSEDVEQQRAAVLLTVWKKMYAALEVRKRIERDNAGMESAGENDGGEDKDPMYENDSTSDADGGFLPDATITTVAGQNQETAIMTKLKDKFAVALPDQVIPQPAVVIRSPHKLQKESIDNVLNREDLFGSDSGGEGGFVRDDKASSEDQERLRKQLQGQNEVDNTVDFAFDDNNAGGFMPEDTEDGASLLVDDTRQQGSNHTRSLVMNTDVDQQPSPKNSEVESKASHTFSDSLLDQKLNSEAKSQDGDNKGNQSDARSETSLLSHDPEEDEAEAQWVEDAFEEDL